MSLRLINLNPDLSRLRDEGYEVRITSNYLLVENVPYVTSERVVSRGTLVSELTLSGDKTARPNTHVAYFTGSIPCNKDGSQITAILHTTNAQRLTGELTVNCSFSNKPTEGYADYHHKMSRYVEMISAPAKSIDVDASAQTFRVRETTEDESVFVYPDTNSSRASISAATEQVAGLKIGIVGLGGTGSYLLDFIAKTPVAEIHVFDGDIMQTHNAFRAPGAPSIDELNQEQTKVEYLKGIYSKMHRGIHVHPAYMDEQNIAELAGLDFVFLSMDKGRIKKDITNFLEERDIAFIDVGIGVELVDNRLMGTVRTTISTKDARDHISKHIGFADDNVEDLYSSNIQIAELNALNATMAVIRWKKHYSFYHDSKSELNSSYTIGFNTLESE
ncbi:ThiF family adenylyltransferase [Coraliomargarita algicola]|uniref:ThiF family adenylyltransferase n=2 Tax=Coraliomargaritaceae TaxID=3056371 RepID=A0ABU1AXD0_9BACT|nr:MULTISPECIES: ThiF family adenylyltransferase [unclassified Coraliomargarita]MDQ8208823.1 ThiF family adenylyltransferase [Coraliomargarita sp. SDUM461003]WPJ94790.1 ThiF family adenylyltransferase [Coraliomargarita sp. J2-16]